MDSSTFASATKDEQSLDYALNGLHGDAFVLAHGADFVKDISHVRDTVRDLLAKSVEARETAVSLSKKYFGDQALTLVTTFQQRLAEANKVPKKSKRASSSAKTTAKKAVPVEDATSNVVELVLTKTAVEPVVEPPVIAVAVSEEKVVAKGSKKRKSAE